VYPEHVVQPKTILPSAATSNGFTDIDAFAIEPYGTNVWLLKGRHYMAIQPEAGTVTVPKTPFPEYVTSAGFTSVDAFTILADGHFVFVKDGYYMAIKGDQVAVSKTLLPAALKDNGFSSVDSMGSTLMGDFLFTKGSQYIHIRNESVTDSGCIPSIVTSKGFDSLDGMSFSSDGTMWFAKGSYYMGVKFGGAKQTKTALPSVLAQNGFDSVDSLHIHSNNEFFFTKGSSIIRIAGDQVDQSIIPQAVSSAGFASIQGLSVSGDGQEVCVANEGHYMCMQDGVVTLPKTAFPDMVTHAGFYSVDGFIRNFIDDSDYHFAVAQDGYYMTWKSDGVVTTPKTELPVELTTQLCGPAFCDNAGSEDLSNADSAKFSIVAVAFPLLLAVAAGIGSTR
jgi:hypothetical protein